MDKLKNLLKSDTPTDEPSSTSRSGTSRLTGQGSHFRGKDESSATTGSTVTGTEPQTRGPADISAAPASSTAAATTRGPEQGGAGHVNTISPTQGNTGGAQQYTIGGSDFPKTQSSADGSGSAAIGQTSTYSSSHLTQGDPTSSVIDPSSSDPLTYKKPESGSHPTQSGVSSGAAATAAGLAFNQGEERRKETMSGYENPYRSEHLDPRVDGLSAATAAQSDTTRSRATPSHGTSTGVAPAPAPARAPAPASNPPPAQSRSKAQDNVVVPSTLSTTVDPADRSAEYGSTTVEKGLSASGTETSSVPQTEHGEQRQSMVGRMLGAVGLGGVAGALGGNAASGHDSTAVADTPDQPTTTTGLSSYTAPTQQGPPTGHHRKESIPTTAYPSATFDSVRAINPPLGGAGSPVVHGEHEGHSSSNAATGAAAGGAAVGAAVVGDHEYERSKALREGISGEPHGVAPTLKESGDTRALTGVDPSRYNESQAVRQNISGAGGTSSGISSIHHATTIDEGTTTSSTSPGTYTGTGPIPGDTHSSSSTVGPVAAAAAGASTHGHKERYTEPAATSTSSSGLATGDTTALPTRTGRYDTERTTDYASTAPSTQTEAKDNSARNTAIGAGAGAAAAGAGAYGAHEYSKREAEKTEAEAAKEQARREKDLAREQQAREKDLEDRRKAEEKAAEKEERHHQKELEKEEKHRQKELEKEEKHRQKEIEKEEKHHQKEIEKEEKHHQKELEKEEKLHQRELEKEEKERDKEREKEAEVLALKERRAREKEEARIAKQREEEEEERRIREERERLAAGVGIGGAAGAGAAAADDDETREKHKEKKPSIFKRIFKRRKNKDTGVEEEYSSDEEVPHGNPEAAHHYGEKVIGVGHPTTYEEQSGGAQKPSYNPFSKHDAVATSGLAAGTTAYAEKSTAPATVESTGTHTHQPTETVTGVPTSTTTHTHQTAPSTLESTGTRSHQPAEAVTGTNTTASNTLGVPGTGIQHDPITGLAYDPSKDPEAARRLSSHTHGLGADGSTSVAPDFKLGEIGETRR